MTGFDTSQFERARQAGAQLGTEQFGMLEQFAANRERARMEQEALQQRAQQIAFGQSLDLRQQDFYEQNANRNYGLDQQRESRLAQAFQLDTQRAAFDFQQAQQEQAARLQTAKVYGDLLIRQLDGQHDEKQAKQDEAVAMGAVQATPNPIGDAVASQGAQDHKTLRRMIRTAAESGNVDLMPILASAVDDEKTRAISLQRAKWALDVVHGNPALIADPATRAYVEVLLKTQQDDLAHRLIEEQVKLKGDIAKENAKQAGKARGDAAVGDLYDQMAERFTKGLKTGIDANASKSDRLAFEATQSQYVRNKSAADAARSNQAFVLPDKSVVLDGGRVGPDGFVRIARPDGSEQAVSPADFAAMMAPGLAHLATGGAGATQPQKNPQDLIDQMILDGASDEEIAAALGAQ